MWESFKTCPSRDGPSQLWWNQKVLNSVYGKLDHIAKISKDQRWQQIVERFGRVFDDHASAMEDTLTKDWLKHMSLALHNPKDRSQGHKETGLSSSYYVALHCELCSQVTGQLHVLSSVEDAEKCLAVMDSWLEPYRHRRHQFLTSIAPEKTERSPPHGQQCTYYTFWGQPTVPVDVSDSPPLLAPPTPPEPHDHSGPPTLPPPPPPPKQPPAAPPRPPSGLPPSKLASVDGHDKTPVEDQVVQLLPNRTDLRDLCKVTCEQPDDQKVRTRKRRWGNQSCWSDSKLSNDGMIK